MIKTLSTLVIRNEFMKNLCDYFLKKEITSSVVADFKSNITDGTKIIGMLIKKYSMHEVLINRLDSRLLSKVENYFLTSEYLLRAAGVHVETEYCKTLEASYDFQDERLLLLKYLTGGIKNPHLL